jgi:hypothetical protein
MYGVAQVLLTQAYALRTELLDLGIWQSRLETLVRPLATPKSSDNLELIPGEMVGLAMVSDSQSLGPYDRANDDGRTHARTVTEETARSIVGEAFRVSGRFIATQFSFTLNNTPPKFIYLN